MKSNFENSYLRTKHRRGSPASSRIGTGTFSNVAAVFLAVTALLTLPAAVLAQAVPVPRVAVVYMGTPETDREARESLAKGLSDRGYTNARNVVLDEAFVNGRNETVRQTIDGLLRRKPAVLVVAGSHAAQAAKAATSTVPIVVATMGDPVAQGLVASLARPGGNLTGNFIFAEALGTKRLELLKELLPKAAEIGYLWNPTNPVAAWNVKNMDAAAKRLGVRLTHLRASSEAMLDEVLAALPGRRLDALLLSADGTSVVFRKKIVASLAASRIPAMYPSGTVAAEGGLISYASSGAEFWRNAASFVDRILKGAKPGDLPIEQATKFELVVNLKTAKALGITIPQSILLRADRVIE